MKRPFKFFISLIIFAALLAAFSFTAFCTDAVSGETLSERESIANGEGEPADGNIFEELYALIESNLDKLLSALAFLGTLAALFAYRRGLMPAMKSGLDSFASALASIKGELAKREGEEGELLSSLGEVISKSEECILKFTSSMEKLEAELEELKKSADTSAKIEKLYGAELEILYEVFMSSSLPQYQKDRIGESFARIQKKLGGAQHDGEN